jgi:hypothetical protein
VHHPGHDAEPLGLAGVDHPAGEQQLEGAGGPDEARQQPADADVAARQADAHEGHVEAGLGRGEAHVAGEGEGEAPTRGRAVHGGDDRLAQAPQLRHERRDVLLGRHAGLHGAEALCPGGGAGALQVEAGAEAAAGAGEDHDPARPVGGDRVECGVQVGDQLVAHGVEPLGAVERQEGDARLRVRQLHG